MRRYLFLRKSVAIICISIWMFSGCGLLDSNNDKKDDQKEEENYIKLPATTKVMNETTINNLISISDNGEVLKFSADNDQLQNISIGDIIITGSIDKAPGGLLKKVSNISSSANEWTLTTEKTTMEEAFESAHITRTITLKSDEIETSNLLKGAKLIKPQNNNDPSYLIINLSNVEIVDGVTVSGSIGFSIDLDFGVDVDLFTLKKLSFIVTTSCYSDLNFNTTATLDINEQVCIGSIDFMPITFCIGPVPVVITIELGLYVGMDGEVSVGINTGVIQEIECEGGLKYEGGWQHVKDYTSDFESFTPELSAGCHIRAYLGPELSMKLYGLAGPYSYLHGYIELNASKVDNVLWWGLYGGFEGGFGVKIEALGETIADYEPPDPIINYKKPLCSGYGGESYNWEIQTIDNTPSEGKFSIAMDANDYPYICYQAETGNDEVLRIAHFNDDIWDIETVDDLWYLSCASWPKLKIDNDGNLHSLYLSEVSEGYPASILKYAKCVNNTWIYDTLEVDRYYIDNIILLLDNNNVPHIFYNDRDYSYYYRLYYLKKDGAQWIKEIIAGPANYIFNSNGSFSAALDRQNNPHVFYQQDKWIYAYKNNNWVKEDITQTTQLLCHSALSLDNNDNPYIAYTYYDVFDPSYQWNLNLLNKKSGQWSCENVDKDDVGLYIDLAFDQNNCAHMAYYDLTNDKLKYARWLGEGWGIETVDKTADVGKHCSMTLDSNGDPHIVYYDATNQNIKYAKWKGQSSIAMP